mmetsp:Transcript_48139/g.55443  ORF Transcript_48139/g.55443 Transcript_48139/m.55443 type:complete len:102 (+) Transcript_48139:42-347(+)
MSWGSVGKSLRELRFVFCSSSQHSAGMRQFVAKNYSAIKTQNPQFPLLVRECLAADPYIIARYEFGVEKKLFTENLNHEEVGEAVKILVDSAAEVNASLKK